ncbi:hypothetical protein GP486_004953 [Trichoglossum hirsutum]|uniref:BZIP domain-containing protein n=1 Tax=Trichoglossum hirsutum TaxID=265104 RepID=A0A9P8RN47_9PEZI|nr:hypothetical protein GP486_004953 [Trichoglossum hirsutum]
MTVKELYAKLQNSLPHYAGPNGHRNTGEEGGDVKCSTCGSKDCGHGDPMLQRKSAVGPSSNSTDGSRGEVVPAAGDTSAVELEALYTGQNPRQASERLEHASMGTFAQNVAIGALNQRPSRLDVNRILNPTPPGESDTKKSRRRSASHLDSPSPSGVAHRSSKLPRPPTTDVSPEVLETPPPSTHTHPGTLGRRILTPRSPGLRAASMGRPSISGLISVQQSPFLPRSGGVYPMEHGVSGAPELPPVPTPPAVQQPHSASSYGFPPVAPTPPIPSRRASSVALQMAQSQAASPSTSYSSFSQPSHTSPASHFRPLASQELQTAYPHPSQFSSRGTHQGSGRSTGSPPESSYSSAPGSWQQNKYQLYFGSGEQGSIPVPVDIHAASKQADEKRKRNAGASARFRARRKEKEREASHTIAKLEQQIRELTEERDLFRIERDFYHSERNYFRSLLYGTPQQQQQQQQQQGHLPPRPISPRLRSNRQVQYVSVGAPTSSSPWVEDQGEDVMQRKSLRRADSHPSDHMPHLPDAKASLGGSPTGYTVTSATSDQRVDLTCSDSNSIPRNAPYNPFQSDTYNQGRRAAT